jgi:hypothetical protein
MTTRSSASEADQGGRAAELTRRTVIAAAATTGAILAAEALSTPASAATEPSARLTGDVPNDVVAHVRDARTGLIDVYVGERHVEVRDRRLAAHLIKASR